MKRTHAITSLLLLLLVCHARADEGMCTHPPAEAEGSCGGGGSEAVHDRQTMAPFIIDVTATIHKHLPTW